eukprot:12229911-Alexandrium_andersonii.AAC.1
MRHHGREPALEDGARSPSIELDQAAHVSALVGDASLEEHPGDSDAGRIAVGRVARVQTESGHRLQ